MITLQACDKVTHVNLIIFILTKTQRKSIEVHFTEVSVRISTLKIHIFILELYDAFDNLVYSCHSFKIQGCDKVHCGNLVTMFVQPCDNLATTLSQPCHNLATVSKYKVVPRLHCGNLVTMFGQPCDNVRTTLSQPCDSFKIQGCAKVVTRL